MNSLNVDLQYQFAGKEVLFLHRMFYQSRDKSPPDFDSELLHITLTVPVAPWFGC